MKKEIGDMSKKRKYFKNDMFQVMKGNGIKNKQKMNRQQVCKQKINLSHYVFMMYSYSRLTIEASEKIKSWIDSNEKSFGKNKKLSELEDYDIMTVYMYFNDKEHHKKHDIDVMSAIEIVSNMIDEYQVGSESISEMNVHDKHVDAIETIHKFSEQMQLDHEDFKSTSQSFQDSFKDFVYYTDKVYKSDFYDFMCKQLEKKDGSISPFIVEIDTRIEDYEKWDLEMTKRQKENEITPADLVNCTHYLDLT